MKSEVSAVLAEYDARAAREFELLRTAPGRGSVQIDDLLLYVGPATGSFLNTLIKSSRACNILEIGTSYGYSTVWLAEAAAETGGRVTTLEVAAHKQDYARAMLAKAGLDEVVDFRLGDARKTLPQLADGFELVLLDLWKDLYIPCLELFVPKLQPGAIIVADNMLQPRESRPQALAYRRAVRALPGVTSVLLPIGSGLEVSRVAGLHDQV